MAYHRVRQIWSGSKCSNMASQTYHFQITNQNMWKKMPKKIPRWGLHDPQTEFEG